MKKKKKQQQQQQQNPHSPHSAVSFGAPRSTTTITPIV
jgi:hypothetical protein